MLSRSEWLFSKRHYYVLDENAAPGVHVSVMSTYKSTKNNDGKTPQKTYREKFAQNNRCNHLVSYHFIIYLIQGSIDAVSDRGKIRM